MRVEEGKRRYIWLLGTEMAFAAVIPVIICWCFVPTRVLNAGIGGKMLEMTASVASAVILIAGIPVGAAGIRASKRMKKWRGMIRLLSIINLFAGIIEVGVMILIIGAVMVGGVGV